MIKLNIVDFKDYEYTLEDSNKKTYILNLEFYDLEASLNINDTIYISEKLLNKKERFYAFGRIGDESGKKNIDENSEELIGIKIKDNDIIYLQRYYG